MLKYITIAISIAALAACQTTMDSSSADTAAMSDTSGVSLVSVATVAEAETIGATRLNEAMFTSQLVDKELISSDGSWTWTIGSDGNAPSAALDGSWEVPESAWVFRDGKYCREVQGSELCSFVYEAGGVYRWTKDDQSFVEWSAMLR